MAGRPAAEHPQETPQVLKVRQQSRRIAIEAMRRRRRTLAVHGSSVVGPVIQQSASPRVVLQSDFVNIVETPSAGFDLEVEITRDADGNMHFWAKPP